MLSSVNDLVEAKKINTFTATRAGPSWMLKANPQRYHSAAVSNDTGAILPCFHLIYSPKAMEEWSPLRRVSRALRQLLFPSQ